MNDPAIYVIRRRPCENHATKRDPGASRLPHLPGRCPRVHLRGEARRLAQRPTAPKGNTCVSSRTASIDPNRDTYYQLLGVDYRATTADITRAYRRSMKEWHPDRVPPSRREETEAVARRLNDAYATLKDPVKRQQYDRSIRVQELQDQIMNRYVGGLAGPGMGGLDRHGESLRRERTPFEQAESRRTSREAMLSLLRAFVLLTAVVIGLLLVFAVISTLGGLVS